MILFIGATRTVHTCRAAALHAVLSFLVLLFASYDPQSHKVLQFYCFQIFLSKKVEGGMGGEGGAWPPDPPGLPPLIFMSYRV